MHILDRETFGHRLKSARKQMKWTLAELAERSGVSITTISRAERGLLALGYDNLASLGKALNMDMSTMFSTMGKMHRPTHSPVLTKAGEGVVYYSPTMSYEFLGTASSNKSMTPLVATVYARAIDDNTQFVQHEGEEFVFVLSGVVEVHFDTGDVFRLQQGDSLYYESQIGHTLISVSKENAKIISVVNARGHHTMPDKLKAIEH
jgi:transcriptional regulator with XRE-family HTH domain